MLVTGFRNKIKSALSQVDIELGGNRPWDLQIHNDNFFACLLLQNTLGLGESYMKGWWDCQQLDDFFCRILRGQLEKKIKMRIELLDVLRSLLINIQKPELSFKVAEKHYDIGNDLYLKMLDKRLIYSCAYWQNAQTLDEAQEAKLDLVAKKLSLSKGMRVLDIGCGWGGAAKFMAEHYGVEVVGVTVSKQQAELAKKRCQGLPIEIRLQDYRDVSEKFERIFSIGMFEHVGYKNYRSYFQFVNRCLKKDGLFLLHTIGSNISDIRTDRWIARYIFPNSMLPSAKQISAACEHLFVIEDWHNFGSDYDKTLMQWFKNFDQHWSSLADDYDNTFYRMWRYYLLSCAGIFRARHKQLWQIVLSPQGLLSGYQSIR